MTPEAWVDAKDVERVYRDVQCQVLGETTGKRRSAPRRRCYSWGSRSENMAPKLGQSALSDGTGRISGVAIRASGSSDKSTSASCTRPTKPQSMSRLRSGSPGRSSRTNGYVDGFRRLRSALAQKRSSLLARVVAGRKAEFRNSTYNTSNSQATILPLLDTLHAKSYP
jgi:hypothetical protein